MDVGYFNFSWKYAESWWDRSSFVRHWWRLYSDDPRWVPPYYPAFRRFLEPRNNPHLGRFDPSFLTIEALRRRKKGRSSRNTASLELDPYFGGSFEQSVATAILLRDPRRRDRTAYLALLHCVNDAESLERLLEAAVIQLAEEGFNRLETLSSLSPYLGCGFLQDHWDQIPPLGTPYDPPYLMELLGGQLSPGTEEHLYWFPVPSEPPDLPVTAVMNRLNPLRLAGELLPLFRSGRAEKSRFPATDSIEAQFLLEWVSLWPVEAWVATTDGKEAGFILVGPDLALAFLKTKGGKKLIPRFILKWSSRKGTTQGRIYFGGVLPEYRQKGVGKLLLQHGIRTAQQNGWEQLVIGPVMDDSPTVGYLEEIGALRGAGYRTYWKEI